MNKKIKLKAGDLIEFVDNSKIIIGINKNGNGLTIEEIEKQYNVKIKKVVRPNGYEQIYDKKQILDKAEKRYLKEVIRPFKKIVISISKRSNLEDKFISIKLINNDSVTLPYFRGRKMYEGMELYKEYTIEELELHE